MSDRKKNNPVDFDKAAEIRRGDLDDELPGYEIITGWIQRVPITWLPGLLIAVVCQCAMKNVFKDDEAMGRVVASCASKARDPNSILRKQPEPQAETVRPRRCEFQSDRHGPCHETGVRESVGIWCCEDHARIRDASMGVQSKQPAPADGVSDEDENKPVDEEWLKLFGWHPIGNTWYPPESSLPLNDRYARYTMPILLWCRVDGTIRLGGGNEWTSTVDATRAHLRALCAALQMTF